MTHLQIKTLEQSFIKLKKTFSLLNKKYGLTQKNIYTREPSKMGFVTYFTNTPSTFLLILCCRTFFPSLTTRVLFIQRRGKRIPRQLKHVLLALGVELEIVSPSQQTSTVYKGYGKPTNESLNNQDCFTLGPLTYRAKASQLIALNPHDGLNLLLNEEVGRNGRGIFRTVFPETISQILAGLVQNKFSQFPSLQLFQLQSTFNSSLSQFNRENSNSLVSIFQLNLPQHRLISNRFKFSESEVNQIAQIKDAQLKDVSTLLFMLVQYKGQTSVILKDFFQHKGWRMPHQHQRKYAQTILLQLVNVFRFFEPENWWIVTGVYHQVKGTSLLPNVTKKAFPRRTSSQSTIYSTRPINRRPVKRAHLSREKKQVINATMANVRTYQRSSGSSRLIRPVFA